MATLADRIAPKAAAKALAKHGALASLHSVRANLTATGIKITPPVEERVFIASTRTEELRSVAYLAALDAVFVAAGLPEPRPGDVLTVTRTGRAVTLGEGTGTVPTGEAVAVYKLVWGAG